MVRYPYLLLELLTVLFWLPLTVMAAEPEPLSPAMQQVSPSIREVSPAMKPVSPQMKPVSPTVQPLKPQLQPMSPSMRTISPQAKPLSPALTGLSVSLSSLTGWNIHGLADLEVTNVVAEKSGEFSGKLAMQGTTYANAPQIVGFKVGLEKKLVVAIFYSGFHFSDLLPAGDKTPLDDITAAELAVLLTPSELNGRRVKIPPRIGRIALPLIGGSVQRLETGASVFSVVSMTNGLRRLLELSGAATAGLSLEGKIHPQMLRAGKVRPKPLHPQNTMAEVRILGKQTSIPAVGLQAARVSSGDDLIDSCALAINLRGIHPAGWPRFLEATNSSLIVKGVKGKIASGIKTELVVRLQREVLRFPHTTITLAEEMTPSMVSIAESNASKMPMASLSGNGSVLEIVSSPVSKSGQSLRASFPVPDATITSLSFTGRLGHAQGSKDEFSLHGKFGFAGSAEQMDFSARLTGGSPAECAIGIGPETGVTLARMLGWGHSSVLDTLVVKNIQTSNANGLEYSQGTISAQRDASELKILVFNGSGQATRMAAVECTGRNPLTLASLHDTLKNTPVADLQLISPVFVLVPKEVSSHTIPAAISRLLQLPAEQNLRPGLNLAARTHVTGSLRKLLELVNIRETPMAVTGSLPLEILSSQAQGGRMMPFTPSIPGGGVTPWQAIGPGTMSAEGSFIKAIDLQIPLGRIAIPNQPAFLSFANSALVITGVSGRIAAGISASLSVEVGRGRLLFPDAVLNSNKDSLSIESGSIKPASDLFSLSRQVADATITSVKFHGTINVQDRTRDSFLLQGQYSVRGSAKSQPLVFTLSGGSPADYSIALTADTTLDQLLGWNSGGFDRITIRDIQVGTDYTSGTFSMNNLSFKVAVFSQGTAKCAAFGNDSPFALSDLHQTLKTTPLNDLQLTKAAFLFTPQSVGTSTFHLPSPVAGELNMPPSFAIKPGLNLVADFQPQGDINRLLRGLTGGVTALPPIHGSINPAIFSSPSGFGQEVQLADIVQGLNLQVDLAALKPPGFPDFATFTEGKLTLKEENGQIRAAVETELLLRIGDNTLDFEDAEISVKNAQLSLSARVQEIPVWMTLPGIKATITSLALDSAIGEDSRASSELDLSGTYTTADSTKPESFVVSLSGGSTAAYSISVNSDTTLGQLLGWQEPGLEDLIIRNIQAGTANGVAYTQGTFALSDVNIKPFTVIVFKAPGQNGANGAFLYDGTISLPEFAPQLAATPLNQLTLTNPGFILAPAGVAATPIELPAPLAAHLGTTTLTIKPGLNLNARTEVVKGSELEQLLDRVGGKFSDLPLNGTLDPQLLAEGTRQVARDILASIDLDVALKSIDLPGVGQNAAITNPELVFRGIDGGNGVEMSVLTDVAITAGPAILSFEKTSISIEKTTTGTTVAVSGTCPATWSSPLGVDWLDVSDLTLKASFGATNSLAVSGTTQVGNVKNLVVALDLAENPGQTEDLELSLTGADIPFTDIPVLQDIPNGSNLKLRDLVISNQEIGGTLKTDLALLNEAKAIAFASGDNWNLAVELEDLKFSQLLPLPEFSKPLLDSIDLQKLAIVFSSSGISSQISDLPVFTQNLMQEIYGTTQGMVQVQKGVNMLLSLDPGKLSPVLGKMLPGNGKLALQGGIGGIFGGPISLNIAAIIPPVSLPDSLNFVVLPKNVQTAFFISLDDVSVAAGLELIADISAKIGKQTVIFDSTIKFELDSDGGVAIDLQGGTLSPWLNPVGINGLTLDTGTRLELFIAASSEVTLTIVGKSHIGQKEVDLTGSASLLVAEEIIDKAAFEGKVSELGLEDLLELTNAVANATGGKPVQGGLPTAKMTNVDLAFASPGVDIPEINLSGGGIRIAGDIWLLLKDKALGRGFAQISESGLILNGSLADFTVGAVSFKNNVLDCQASIMPPATPYFKINGDVVLFKQEESVGLTIAPAEMELHADLNLGQILNFDFLATAGTPDGGLTMQDLEKYDMSLESHLKSDIPGWLRTDGKKPVNDLVGGFKQQLDSLLSDVKTAQQQVDSLNVQISQAEDAARKNAKNVVDAEQDAKNNVDHLGDLIAETGKDIDDAKAHIHKKCDYTKEVFGVKVPDVPRNAKCASENIAYGSKLAALETKKEALVAAKDAADKTLSDLQKGESTVDPADVDPQVVALKAELVTATAALQTAEQLAQGVEDADEVINDALTSFAQENTFVLKNSLIQGSLQKALGGDPVMMGLDIEVEGKESQLSLGLSFTDPAYTIDQLNTLALFVFSQIVESVPNAPPALVKLVHDAYATAAGTTI